ncbi:MAG: DSD1 family PLP-dependent enzyme [Gemmataceae bacterium]
MSDSLVGQPISALDTPQLLVDLDVVDANVGRLLAALAGRSINVRAHFKSLKCTGLAKYLHSRGIGSFLCAKLSEAEVLADAGLSDIFIANQVVGPIKLNRLAALGKRAKVRVCVDDPGNIDEMAAAARAAGATLEVLVEVNVGMNRCGVEPGEPALALARHVHKSQGLRFVGLQGYDGHLQLLADAAERKEKSNSGSDRLVATAKLIEQAGIPCPVVTGAGTGTWEFVGFHEGVTEIQPGSFVLMDVAYHKVRPEFGCSLSILTSVLSKNPGRYILDAGSKAISQDFGTPGLKNRPQDKVARLSEEHTRVEADSSGVKLGDKVEVIPAHCCATMNLHRRCIAVRTGKVEAVWPIEASGRYD